MTNEYIETYFEKYRPVINAALAAGQPIRYDSLGGCNSSEFVFGGPQCLVDHLRIQNWNHLFGSGPIIRKTETKSRWCINYLEDCLCQLAKLLHSFAILWSTQLSMW